MSLEERVRRKLILAGILPKLSNFDQGAIGQAIEAAGAGQFGRLHKEALKLHDRIRCTIHVRVIQVNKRVLAGPNEQDPVETVRAMTAANNVLRMSAFLCGFDDGVVRVE